MPFKGDWSWSWRSGGGECYASYPCHIFALFVTLLARSERRLEEDHERINSKRAPIPE